ncbi:hypothetical protein CKAH01_02408 [Colletotrichum kahawae]|uniref:Uncharacterized protein n=1 Tax=Colletotrichum kahawae TaxID=34407 RepID=A0AAD9XZS1_COLKA|nr:hypothetical protein CKAH01_02408 [Colletotrichum kahawae]
MSRTPYCQRGILHASVFLQPQVHVLPSKH